MAGSDGTKTVTFKTKTKALGLKTKTVPLKPRLHKTVILLTFKNNEQNSLSKIKLWPFVWLYNF